MTDLGDLESRLRAARSTIDRQIGELGYIEASATTIDSEIADLKDEVEVYSQVSILLNSIGEQQQVGLQNKIESLVTKGLHTIFADNLSFHLVQSTKANTQSIDFIVRTEMEDGTQIDTPVLDARGGGVAATVGFLLRLVMLLMSPRTKNNPVLFLDETFAHLSKDRAGLMAEFLREVVDKTRVQIVMVTHDDAFAEVADRAYRLSLRDDVTVIRDISPEERDLYE